MYQFLRQLIRAAFIFLLFLGLMFVIIGSNNKRIFANECMKTTAFVLFAGDSHIQLGLDANLIHSSKNIANLGEAYIYTYEKLVFYLQYNHTIKQIYLGVGCHNFSSYYDGFSHDRLPDYLPIFSFKEQLKKSYDAQYGFVNIVSPVLYNGIINSFKKPGQYTYSGGFSNYSLNRDNNDSLVLPRINSQFYHSKGRLKGYSDSNMKYLKKIINLCNKKGIRLYLIATPLHPEYRKKVPSSYITKRNNFLSREKVEFVNFDEMRMPEGSFMPDGDHLTASDAAYFTKYLNQKFRF